MRRLFLIGAIAALAACGSGAADTTPTQAGTPTGTVAGAWTGSLAEYTQIRVRMTERTDDHALFGNWAGDRANCSGACRDTGIVSGGGRNGTAMAFAVTALNGTRSLSITGVMAADSSITGTAIFTDDGTHGASEIITLRRH